MEQVFIATAMYFAGGITAMLYGIHSTQWVRVFYAETVKQMAQRNAHLRIENRMLREALTEESEVTS